MSKISLMNTVVRLKFSSLLYHNFPWGKKIKKTKNKNNQLTFFYFSRYQEHNFLVLILCDSNGD